MKIHQIPENYSDKNSKLVFRRMLKIQSDWFEKKQNNKHPVILLHPLDCACSAAWSPAGRICPSERLQPRTRRPHSSPSHGPAAGSSPERRRPAQSCAPPHWLGRFESAWACPPLAKAENTSSQSIQIPGTEVALSNYMAVLNKCFYRRDRSQNKKSWCQPTKDQLNPPSSLISGNASKRRLS